MKKCVLFVLVLLSLGCSLYDKLADYSYESKIHKVDIYYLEEFYELKTIWDISDYLNVHVEYRADEGDEWSTTEGTLTRGYGDCEDFAIAFLNIYYVVFNEKCDLYRHGQSRCILKNYSCLYASPSFEEIINFYSCTLYEPSHSYLFGTYFY